MTEANYKISFKESSKAVSAEVVVMGNKGEDVLEEAQELFDKAQSFSKVKTLQKNI